MRLALLAPLAVGLATCGGGDDAPLPPVELHLGAAVDAAGEGMVAVTVAIHGTRAVIVHLDGAPRIIEVQVDGATATLGATAPATPAAPTAGGWFRPRPVTSETVTLTLTHDGGEALVTVWTRGAPVPAAARERSLVWIDPAVVDDPTIVSLGRVLAATADDGHGGVLLDRWFRRFATTAHSERAAPASFMDEVAAQQGADPTAWDLDALPFRVTAVHNRLDLGARDGDCGQLRVSFASTHAVYAPLHLIFLFRQPPAADDVAPDGTTHCLGTARRWARLAALDGTTFAAVARVWLAGVLRREHFLLAETVELTVSPWEWRQWVRVGVDELDNPPLFQTVDVPALNAPGALRDDFLAWAAANAAAVDARTIELPARFRAPSARVPPAAARTPLDLTGLDPAVAAAYPDLRHAVEIVGCPTCHTDDAEFVQTTPQRTFSPFYDLEIDARAARLDLMNAGADVPVPPFGPLQAP